MKFCLLISIKNDNLTHLWFKRNISYRVLLIIMYNVFCNNLKKKTAVEGSRDVPPKATSTKLQKDAKDINVRISFNNTEFAIEVVLVFSSNFAPIICDGNLLVVYYPYGDRG